MEIFWFSVLAFMLIMFIILDGFDFGAGMVHLFFAKKEKDKQAIVKSIGPFWDANEVWLIAAGGIMFFAFPKLYAAAFSGFYLPLMLILWLLIFRAIGLELRGQFKNSIWQNIWDKSFGIASMLLALFFGVALANCMRGVYFNQIEDSAAHYFFLPLWSESFSPKGNQIGVIDVFTLMFGFKGLLVLLVHGANWIIFKTNASINSKLKRIIPFINGVIGILAIITLIYFRTLQPNAFQNYLNTPVLFIFPVLLLGSWVGLFRVSRYKSDRTGFSLSSTLIFSGIATIMAMLYPNFILPMAGHPEVLNIENTITESYGLEVGLVWFSLGIILVAFYFTLQFKLFKGKLDNADYGDH